MYSSGALFTGLGDGTLGEQNKYYSSGSLLTGTAANGACYINGEERLYPDSFIFGDYGSTPVTDTNLNMLSNYWRSDTWLPATCFPDSNDTVTITAPITSGTLTTQTINLQSSFSGGTLNASVTIGKGGEVAGVMTGGTINGDVTFGVTGWASASYPILEGGTINGNVTFESGSIMVGGIITGNITWNGFTGQYSKPGASYDGKYFAGGHLRQPEDGPLNGSYYINGEVVGACSGDCYLEGSSPNYAQGLSIGSLRSGPDNTTLTLQYANGTDGFKVWREKDGNRILNATGLIANGWQKMLVRAGTAFSASDFTAGNNIAGRVCPTHVFLNHTNMTATNRCVYYDEGNTAQTLDAESSTGQEGLDWLTEWNRSETGQESASSYYEGNIKTCADKGMRLPTVYETTAEPFEDFLPPGDGISPTWAGGTNGVPGVSSSQTWTASASSDASFIYYSWSGSGSGSAYSYAPDPEAEEQGVDDSLSVRCVLPSH
ncbi:MAG: polymer-forming cytoskeletal protein [Proteobacteria bacterium]|nr:polymer-forming cytoskeletal protein [Pseudomonadota bacterium]